MLSRRKAQPEIARHEVTSEAKLNVTGHLAEQILALQEELISASEYYKYGGTRRERRRRVKEYAGHLAAQDPRLKPSLARGLALRAFTPKPVSIARTWRSPLFFKEKMADSDGAAIDQAWFVEFDAIPIMRELPFVQLHAYLQRRNEETGEVTDTKMLRIFMSHDEETKEGTVSVFEEGNEISTEDNLFFTLGVIQAARTAVAPNLPPEPRKMIK